MRLLILGATGRTGGHLPTQALPTQALALAAGPDVTALTRTPKEITTRHRHISH